MYSLQITYFFALAAVVAAQDHGHAYSSNHISRHDGHHEQVHVHGHEHQHGHHDYHVIRFSCLQTSLSLSFLTSPAFYK